MTAGYHQIYHIFLHTAYTRCGWLTQTAGVAEHPTGAGVRGGAGFAVGQQQGGGGC